MKIDLRPFEPSTAIPAVTIGLIYLIMVAFFSFSFLLPIHNVRILYFSANINYTIPASFPFHCLVYNRAAETDTKTNTYVC